METILTGLGVLFVIGFFIGLSDKNNKSVSEATKSGIGCVIMAIILSILLLIIGKTCSNYSDPNSSINRQIRDGYNLYD